MPATWRGRGSGTTVARPTDGEHLHQRWCVDGVSDRSSACRSAAFPSGARDWGHGRHSDDQVQGCGGAGWCACPKCSRSKVSRLSGRRQGSSVGSAQTPGQWSLAWWRLARMTGSRPRWPSSGRGCHVQKSPLKARKTRTRSTVRTLARPRDRIPRRSRDLQGLAWDSRNYSQGKVGALVPHAER